MIEIEEPLPLHCGRCYDEVTQVFEANCAVCHGADGRGNQSLGVPNLTDGAWINGSGWTAVYAMVTNGRKGEMPTWESRLSPGERKLLTAYVLDLGNQAR